MNAKMWGTDPKLDNYGKTPLALAIRSGNTETADLLRKHGGKTREELKVEGK
ncbi:ankyrin repeat domain-containing protein [Verrucomicrobia bacterium]|nr:ankyrin repeat domain-containing protein [Verrucomicrobiota bacterium]